MIKTKKKASTYIGRYCVKLNVCCIHRAYDYL